MTKFLDVYVGGVRVDDVDDIVSPTEEKPLWLIMRKGKVVACASKGAKVEYHIIDDGLIKQAIEIALSEGVKVGSEGDDKRIQETPPHREYRRITRPDPEDVET